MAKFVQICSLGSALFALDENGEVWKFDGNKWTAVATDRGPTILEIRTKAAAGGYRPGNN
jgi:hypothetical protein